MRIIIPGFIGGRMVKWLSEITVMDTESQVRGRVGFENAFKANNAKPSSQRAQRVCM